MSPEFEFTPARGALVRAVALGNALTTARGRRAVILEREYDRTVNELMRLACGTRLPRLRAIRAVAIPADLLGFDPPTEPDGTTQSVQMAGLERRSRYER